MMKKATATAVLFNSKVSDFAPDVASSKFISLRAVALRLMNFGNLRDVVCPAKLDISNG